MQLRKSLIPLVASLCLLAGFSLAHAEDRPPPPGGPAMGEHCRDNPDKCKEMKEHMQQWCKDHADRCDEMKKKHRQMREECKKDPESCQQKREAMREKFKQRRDEKCQQNPEKCEQWKQHHQPGEGPPEHDGPAAKPAMHP